MFRQEAGLSEKVAQRGRRFRKSHFHLSEDRQRFRPKTESIASENAQGVRQSGRFQPLRLRQEPGGRRTRLRDDLLSGDHDRHPVRPKSQFGRSHVQRHAEEEPQDQEAAQFHVGRQEICQVDRRNCEVHEQSVRFVDGQVEVGGSVHADVSALGAGSKEQTEVGFRVEFGREGDEGGQVETDFWEAGRGEEREDVFGIAQAAPDHLPEEQYGVGNQLAL